MPEETMWEVWARIDKETRWFVINTFQSYKEAKKFYDAVVKRYVFMFCIVRAETHRSIVLEDLKGNVYAD